MSCSSLHGYYIEVKETCAYLPTHTHTNNTVQTNGNYKDDCICSSAQTADSLWVDVLKEEYPLVVVFLFDLLDRYCRDIKTKIYNIDACEHAWALTWNITKFIETNNGYDYMDLFIIFFLKYNSILSLYNFFLII